MSNMVFQTNRKLITVLSADFTFLHPTIDVKNGVAYVGVWLPVKVGKPPKNPDDFEAETEISYDYDFFLVSSEKRFYWIGSGGEARENAFKLGFYLAAQPFKFKQLRWEPQRVLEWISSNEKLNPKEAYVDLKNALLKHIEFVNEDEADFMTLWIIGTYFQPVWKAYPYVYVGGAKQVGKTKLLTLVQLTAFNGLNSVSISTASIFRLCEALAPTICFDETETLHEAERMQEWRAVILGGYKRGSGEAFRVDGERAKKPKSFGTFCPKIFANIQGIEDVLEDRTIHFVLLRGLNPEVVNREVDVEGEEWSRLRDSFYRLFLENHNTVCSIYAVYSATLNDTFNGREWELWKPIFSLAKFFEDFGVEGLTAKMREFACRMVNEKRVDDLTENMDMLLIQTLEEMVAADDFYRVDDVKKRLSDNFPDGEVPRFLNNKWVGRALKRLGFKEKRKVGRYSEVRISPMKITNLKLRFFKSVVFRAVEQTQQTEQTAKQKTLQQTKYKSFYILRVLEHPSVFPTEKCSLCGKPSIYAQINYTDGSWGLLCEECYRKKAGEIEGETQNDG